MRILVAYVSVILIWSTTPLGILWSSETVHPTFAVLMRMVIALLLGSIILRLWRIELPKTNSAIRLYCYSGIGVFGGMLFSYLSAQYISSGLMSVIFGLAPIFSGILAQRIIAEPKFDRLKKIALTIALLGLLIVCYDSLVISNASVLGVVYVLIAVMFFSLSAVLVKSIQISIHPVATTVGALLFSTPLFLLVWLVFDGSLPYQQWKARSLWSILYLGIVGSLIGFLAYFYILQKLNASTVALITMVTPIIAMSLGAYLNKELITDNLVMGAISVVCGLSLFQWGEEIKKIPLLLSAKLKRKVNE